MDVIHRPKTAMKNRPGIEKIGIEKPACGKQAGF
jgi:hypothetical protein